MEQALYHLYIGGTVSVPPLVMGDVMLAAPALTDRSMTNYWAEEIGKGNIIIIPRWRPNKKRKVHRSPPISIICHIPDRLCFS
jgi:hypothetical protein